MQSRLCKGCQHHNTCEDVYHRLGHSPGPSVTIHVLVAFVGPLVVFVVALAVAQRMWSCLANPKVMTLVSFLTAVVATTLGAALGAWWLRGACPGRPEKRRNG